MQFTWIVFMFIQKKNTITLWQKRRKNILKYINMYMYTCSFERNMLSLKKSLEKIKIL